MSFRTMDEDELRLAAEGFGIDVAPNVPAESIADMLDEEGATFERWVQMKKAAGLMDVEPEPETPTVPAMEAVEAKKVVEAAKAEGRKRTAARKKAVEANEVIVKMERKNLRYEAFGKVFTQDHPYVVCDVETANNIFASLDGFRMAHPLEAEQFYS